MRQLKRARGLWVLLAAGVAPAVFVVACDSYDSYPYYGTGGFAPTSIPTPTYVPPPQPGPCEGATENQSCTLNVTCEDKKLANPACNGQLRCDNLYTWSRTEADTLECATECPAAYVEQLPDGCTIPLAGTLICEYPEGTCGCAPVRPDGGAEDAGDAGKSDAGKSDGGDAGEEDTTVYEWRCVKPEAGCPRIRPREGDECVKPMTCDYGDCVFNDGVSMHCYSRRWVTQRTSCHQ